MNPNVLKVKYKGKAIKDTKARIEAESLNLQRRRRKSGLVALLQVDAEKVGDADQVAHERRVAQLGVDVSKET